jgi:hypothetical protein
MNKVRLLLAVIWTGWHLAGAYALEPSGDPSLAVVRIKSHGASGTIIATAPGKSWILSCAHMFFGEHDTLDDKYTRKRIVIDGPAQPHAPQVLAASRLLAADPDHDLSLIEIANGPFNYVPVAPAGFQPGRNLSSVGYDEMKWPITTRPATILGSVGTWTYTREKPWHGRSGSGLFDLDGKCLVGVVNGYELNGQGRGIYVSHASVLAFLAKYQGQITNAPRGSPRRISEPRPNPPAPWCPGGT